MTTQLSSTTTCPRWCAGRHDDLGDPSRRVHVRDVAYGVEITAEERDGVTEAARVNLPDFGASVDVTSKHAALLAQSLTEAVKLIDGGARVSPLVIRDTITGRTLTCQPYDVADALAPWFVAAPDDVARGVADLQAAVVRREPTDDLLALLGLVIEGGVR